MPFPAALETGATVTMRARQVATPLWLRDQLCVVAAGTVLARHEPRPSMRRAELLVAGDVVGDGAFGGVGPTFLRAVIPSRLLLFSAPDQDNILSDAETARWVVAGMAVRARRAENYRFNMRAVSVRARVARFVLDWCQSHWTAHVPGPHCGGLSLAMIGDVVGCTRPTVHRHLLNFERAGTVVLEHGGITVEDMSALERRAAAADPYLHGVAVGDEQADRTTAAARVDQQAAPLYLECYRKRSHVRSA